MWSPKSLCVDSSHQQLWRFSSDLGKVHARGMSWGREVSPVMCAGIRMQILSQFMATDSSTQGATCNVSAQGQTSTGLSQRQKQLEW